MPANIELVIALVSPIGADLSKVTKELRAQLESLKYDVFEVRLSDWLETPGATKGFDRYCKLMDAGDDFRRSTGDNAAVSTLAIGHINTLRNDETSKNAAVIVRQLKTPEEIASLRSIYGTRLLVMSCYASRSHRVELLSRLLADAESEAQIGNYRHKAEELVQRDEQDSKHSWGQNVRKAFPEADAFIAADQPERVESDVRRTIEILFRHPYRTPSRDEYGMYLAEAAAMRSCALGRQVGAVIATAEGDPIAVGTNEVPKYGGGAYWEGDCPDKRDFQLGYDTNDKFKAKLVGEMLKRLVTAKWLAEEFVEKSVDELVSDLILKDDAVLRGAQVDGIIEFGRCVHAEMAAIVDASRRGAAVDGAVLYTTTFPCHECARHIVAAGIKRVVYRVPYPKSLVRELYPDSIDVESTSGGNLVSFEPFVGIAPRRYMQFFKMPARKDANGVTLSWPACNKLNLGEYFPPNDIIERDEKQVLAEYSNKHKQIS